MRRPADALRCRTWSQRPGRTAFLMEEPHDQSPPIAHFRRGLDGRGACPRTTGCCYWRGSAVAARRQRAAAHRHCRRRLGRTFGGAPSARAGAECRSHRAGAQSGLLVMSDQQQVADRCRQHRLPAARHDTAGAEVRLPARADGSDGHRARQEAGAHGSRPHRLRLPHPGRRHPQCLRRVVRQ